MCERASLKPGGGNRGGTLGPSRSRPYRCADATAAIASSKSTAPRAFFAGFAAFAFIVLVLLRADDFAPRGELHDRVAEVTGDVAGGHRDLALVGFGKIARHPVQIDGDLARRLGVGQLPEPCRAPPGPDGPRAPGLPPRLSGSG